MKLTFESNLQFQHDAIKSIIDLFEGQPIEGDGWKLDLNKNWTVVKIEENYTLKKK